MRPEPLTGPLLMRVAPLARARAAPTTGTKLLVNLSEPSQVERAAALEVDGVGLLRAELMVIEALGGAHPRLLIEQGRSGEFVRAHGRRARRRSRPASRRGR